ncbi:MAG: RDD family protein [Candidatus Hydrogenedentota bacterium]|nr:MAG: RDD family protein [Candidatus Hydrogenedentota bacterium]
MAKKKQVKLKTQNIEDLVEKIDRGEMVIHYEEIEKLPLDEILEILDFLRREEMEKAFEEVKKIYLAKQPPAIEIPESDLRIWSYYYDRRLAAYLSGFLGLIGYAVANFLWPHTGHEKISFPVIIAVGIFFFSQFIGRIFLARHESKYGKPTPGSSRHREKLGLRIVNKQGKPISFLRAFVRGLLRSFPLSPIMLLSIEISKKKRGFHDKITGTYVIRQNGEASPEEIAQFIQENM